MSRGRRKGLVWMVSAAALLALLLPAVPASASTWTVRQLGGEAARATMFGISCPGAFLCVAVGSNNTVASSTNPTGSAADWDAVYVGAGAIAQGGPNQREIRGVSCPSTQLCVAVSFEGLIYTSTNPTGPASAWAVADLDGEGPNTHLYGVSCPTVSFCVASAGGGKILTSTNPTGGAAAWSVAQLAEPLELRGVSCASASLCVVVGARGGIRPENSDVGQILSTTAPLTGPWRQVQPAGTEGGYFGVSCVGTALCVSGDAIGRLLTSTSPTGPASAWSTAPGGATVQITGASCPSASRCLAVDNNGDAIASTDPTAAGSWSLTNVAPYPGVEETAANGMFGVSCPTVSLCAVAGKDGQLFTSTNPFAEAAEPVKKKSASHRKRPKRPRVTIARGPEPGTETHGRTAKALFRFFARHHVQVRGFVCKIDKRPLRRCRSPKHYRVGLGRHVFRVRAVGWTGLKGPAATYRFKVCHPTRYPDCIKNVPVTPPPPQSRQLATEAAAPTSLHFRAPASNGYSFQVKTQGSQTLVSVWRAGRTARASATYDVSESATPEAIDADLGSLGRIDVRFVPSGETRTIELRPFRKDSDCQAPRRLVRSLGTFTGTISFHGENGYTSVDAVQAWGSVGPQVRSRCGWRPPRGGPHEAPPHVERIWIKENAFLFARHPSSKTSSGSTVLLVSTSRRHARYLVDTLELPRPGLTIQRSASVTAPRSAFTYSGDLSSATLRPPAPFDGEATFSAASHSLSGDLTVALPGVLPLPLTGPDFEAEIDPTR